MILVKNVYLSYTKEYYTLNNINLEVNKGENVVLFGEKESGKSSLLRVIAGLEKATKGNVYLDGTEINKVDFKNSFNLGYISSTGVYLNNKTVKQNLEYVLKIRKEHKDVIKSKVANALIRYNLESLANEKVCTLGDYDKLKLSIARLSLRKIDLFLIDDIFENLSKKEEDSIIKYLKELILVEEVTSVVAVNKKSTAEKFNGRKIKIEFGSIE